jgi:hypothetical protein
LKKTQKKSTKIFHLHVENLSACNYTKIVIKISEKVRGIKMNYVISENENIKKITFFVPDEPTKRVLKEKIAEVFTGISEEKVSSIYLCLKELINYLTAINLMKMTTNTSVFDNKLSLLLNESYLNYSRERFRASGKSISVVMRNVKDGIVIEIYNSEPIPEDHEKEIRKTLRDLSLGNQFALSLSDQNYNFLASIVMTWLMLKDIGIEPSLFRIGNRDKKTFIRIEVPLNENYLPMRIMTSV